MQPERRDLPIQPGGFPREATGRQSFLDPATGYVNLAGTQERFASPVDNNYTFTALTFTSAAFDEYAGVLARRRDCDWAFPVSAAVGLRHRELLGACRAGVGPVGDRGTAPCAVGRPAGTAACGNR
ncbi:hypothetical protein AB0L06_19780 [Spirillospora sp. NPDC052269]